MKTVPPFPSRAPRWLWIAPVVLLLVVAALVVPAQQARVAASSPGR